MVDGGIVNVAVFDAQGDKQGEFFCFFFVFGFWFEVL